MAKGHRSQIKRERNAVKRYQTFCKSYLMQEYLFRKHASY